MTGKCDRCPNLVRETLGQPSVLCDDCWDQVIEAELVWIEDPPAVDMTCTDCGVRVTPLGGCKCCD